MKIYGMLLALTICLMACQQPNQKPTELTSAYKGVDVSIMDTNVAPCADFYRYASGTWLAENPVPESESRWGSIHIVLEKNRKILKELMENAAADTTSKVGSSRQKVGDFYATGMDSLQREKEGFESIKQHLSLVDSIADLDGLVEVIAIQHSNAMSPLFDGMVEQDLKNSSQYAFYSGQGGIGLPDKDYYLSENPKLVAIREGYVIHIANLLKLIGVKAEDAQLKAEAVMRIETELAKVSMGAVEQRDYAKMYNKMAASDWYALSPSLKLAALQKKCGIVTDSVIVTQPQFFKRVEELLNEIAVDDWKSYLSWHLVHAYASKLSSPFVDENFSFYGTQMRGIQVQKPRWKQIQDNTNSALGELVGQEYVKVAFSEDSKQRVNTMVDDLIAAYRESIQNLDWMSQVTKDKALEKLNSVSRKLAYPDKWKDYSKLEIKRDSYALNYMRSRQFAMEKNIAKLGKPIDNTEWHMSPQTVNAYYNPVMNEIVFPAGIMQPPFFNPEADDAVNYGSMGAVIGHELTHGFDDQGKQFDANGNMVNWWTSEDSANFSQRAQVMVDQFNAYEALDSLYVNGELTLGENIADLGGLTIAYAAYQRSLQGKEKQNIDGYTAEQRFFLAFGQVWKSNHRPAALRQQIMTNPHSPAEFRCIGTVSNMPEFFEAFGCEEGSAMLRPDSVRVKIW